MSGRTLLLPLGLALLATPAFGFEFGLVKVVQPPIGVGCYDVKSADLNGDGRADVVAAVLDAQRIAVAFGTVDGLTTPTYYPSGHADAVDLADYDGNGSIDILEADWNENRVRLWLNQGDGTFVLNGSTPVTTNPRDVAGGDFDGNGTRDVAVATGDGKVVFLSGQPGGGFTEAGSNLLGGATKGIAAGDLDNDGDIDLVAIDANGRRLNRLRNDGAMPFVFVALKGFAGSPSDVALADLDGDGFLDAAASLENGSVAVIQGGPADFILPVKSFATGTQSQSVAIADFDGEGSLDLLVSNYDQSTAQVLLNQGGLSFGAVVVGSTGTNPRSAAAGDFDADGRMDAVSGDFTQGTATLLRNSPPFPRLAYSPASLDFGEAGQGLQVVKTVLVQNVGVSPLVVTPGAIDGSEFVYSTSTAPITLQSGGGATIGVRYLRSVLGTATGTLHFTSSDSLAPDIAIPLSGSTVEANPQVSYSPPALDFGTSYLTDAKNLSVNFLNSGNAPVTITPGAVDGAQFAYTSSAPFRLQPGNGKSITVRYLRTAVGDAVGTAHVTTTDADVPEIAIPLSGTTVEAFTQVSWNPHSMDFGTNLQFVASTNQVVFTNIGNQPLLVTPGAIDGGDFIYANPGGPITVQPGFSGTIFVRYQRNTVGTATGTVHVTTNDPDHAAIDIPLTGVALPLVSKITWTPPSLDFGTKFDGLQQVLSITIKNEGNVSLSVTPGAIDGDQFVYDSSSAPFNLAPNATRLMPIRYLRSVTGPATGTLHLSTNDPDAPEVAIALVGVSASPPIASFSAPPPVTVSVGTSIPAAVVVRNTGPSPLEITVPAVAGDETEVNPYDLFTGQQDFWRMSSSEALWNLDLEGRIVTGANSEYRWGMDEANFIVQSGGTVALGGREFRLGPVAIAGGTVVTRKIYVPESGDWARFIDVAENPGEVTRTATFDLFDNIGYSQAGPIRTSDGDEQFELSDDWLVIPAGEGRSVGRLFRTVGAAGVPVVATWFQTTVPGCYSRTKYVATLPPHSRTCVVQWAVQSVDADTAQAVVEALRQDPGPGLVHADAIDRGSPWNLAPDPKPFRPTAGPMTIAPGDSVEIPVTFGAEAATHDADLTSVLRILTNDPQHPVLAVPLAFSIGNGQVIGVDPGPGASAAVLELSGFRPNPMRLSGAARVSFRLATSEPATLTLYDVRGRQVARQVIESPQPGPRSLALTGAVLRPGVVWMRLEQGGRIAKQKGIVLP